MTEASDTLVSRTKGESRTATKARLSWAQMRYPLIGAATVVVLLGIWTLATNAFQISPMMLPSPQLMIKSLKNMLVEGYAGKPLWDHILASLTRTLTGLLGGIACAIPIGLLMGYSRIVNASLMPLFGFIRPIPPIAFIPLVILWFGIGEFSKILLIFAASFNYTVLASAAGMRAVPEQLIRAGTNLGLTPWQLFTSVMLPAAMPQIFTGIKISIAVSWAVVVAAELIAAQAGLGFIIEDAGTFFRTPEVLIGVFIIGAIGLLFEIAITAVERRVLHWQSKA
jgi:ABC-type nitrate/sulfonate/bicarbonate transport system permease component